MVIATIRRHHAGCKCE